MLGRFYTCIQIAKANGASNEMEQEEEEEELMKWAYSVYV